MRKAKNHIPAKVFGPGRVLRDEIEARGMTQDNLAVAIDRSRQFVNGLVNGTRPLTFEVAILLEAALDIDAAIWLRMEQYYRRQEEAVEIRKLQSAVRRRIASAPTMAKISRPRKPAGNKPPPRKVRRPQLVREAKTGRYVAKARKSSKPVAASSLAASRKRAKKRK